MPKIQFNLNGKSTEAAYEPGMHLLEVLREECGIVSAKNGCAPEGACGCCLVLIDGTPALSCLRKPEQTNGRDVVTLESREAETSLDLRPVPSLAIAARAGVRAYEEIDFKPWEGEVNVAWLPGDRHRLDIAAARIMLGDNVPAIQEQLTGDDFEAIETGPLTTN